MNINLVHLGTNTCVAATTGPIAASLSMVLSTVRKTISNIIESFRVGILQSFRSHNLAVIGKRIDGISARLWRLRELIWKDNVEIFCRWCVAMERYFGKANVQISSYRTDIQSANRELALWGIRNNGIEFRNRYR